MRFLASFAITFALALSAKGQLPPAKALAAMKPAAGFQVELFAAEPMLFNPTSIDVDHQGRVWVAEAVNYRRKNFGRPIIRPEGDRIVVLVDEKGDGKATRAVTFYQGKELYGPLGVCVAARPSPDRQGGVSYRVFVCQSPDILVFEDADGDLKADGPPKKFLTGFGGFDHDHGVHGINIGPDGKLYFTVGDAGVRGLQAADKKGPIFTSNTTTIQKGTVWRCNIDGSHLELIAHNFRNNYECCVDSFGEIWLSDNDDDGNQQTRICFVMPGGNYGYGPRGDGKSHWHEEDPGIVHKVLRTGFGSPTGITFYEGSLFPKKYSGALLHCDAGPREVRAFFRKPKGAGYELDKEVILTSTDNWFRPSDVCVAPDGSIFVADWYDKGVGGHGMNDPQDGRIYRLTPTGHKGYRVPDVKLDTKEGVLAALGSPCQATRALGQSKIRDGSRERYWEVRDAGLVERADRFLVARIHTAAIISPDNPANSYGYQLGNLVTDRETKKPAKNESLAAMATRLIGTFSWARPETAEETSLDDPLNYPVSVRREELINMRNLNAGPAKKLLYFYAKLYDGQDIFYRAALNIACGTDPKRRDEILADFDRHFPEWNDKVADLVWELRPKNTLAKLEERLYDRKLLTAQQGRILEILADSDDPQTGLKFLAIYRNAGLNLGIRRSAMGFLKKKLPTKWAKLKDDKTLLDFIAKAIQGYGEERMDAIELAGIAPSPRVGYLLRKIAEGEAEDEAMRVTAIQALGNFKSRDEVKALERVIANSERRNLRSLAVKSLGRIQTKESLAALQKLFASDKLLAELRIDALAALASSRDGTAWLLKLKGDGKFPEPLIADAGRLLRNSPFRDLAARAKLAFPAPGKLDPKKLPAIAVLAKRTGDVARGQKVWDASLAGAAQCAKCHTVRGAGGHVGPDLSMIGKKGGKENILESILMPSKAIADQFIQQSIVTTADVAVSGLVVSDTPQAITLRDANGKDTVIARADIASQKKLSISIMPEDIVAALTEDELIDLAAYLATLQTAAITPAQFQIAGPFAGKDMLDALHTPYGPEKTENPASRERQRPESPDISWRIIKPNAQGYFDLAAFHGDKGNNSASYMRAEFDSPSDQSAEILLGPDDGAKLWVNGKEVFKTEQTRAAAPGADRIAIKLKKGPNSILLKVANGNNPHGFYFTLLSTDEVKLAASK